MIQVLDSETRPPLLARLLELLAPGATVALTLVDESTLLSAGAASTQILPDMREIGRLGLLERAALGAGRRRRC